MHVCPDEDKTTLTDKRKMRAHVQWMWSVVNASCGATQSYMLSLTSVLWSVTQAWMLSLAFALCFVTHSEIISEFFTSCPNSQLVVMM